MANQTVTSRATVNPTGKRRKCSDNHQSLLPGLPDHIAQLCLSLISPAVLYSVCRSWRQLIYSGNFPPFRSLYTLSLPTTAALDGGQMLTMFSFDPICSKWIAIDSPPLPPDIHHLSVRHPSFISRNLPIQALSVSGNLVLLAATSVHRNSPIPAFPHPLIFNPLLNTWSSSPPLSTPRRWCAAGVVRDTVVVASGIGSHYTEKVARSVEKLSFCKNESQSGFDTGFDVSKPDKELKNDTIIKSLALSGFGFDTKPDRQKTLSGFDIKSKPDRELGNNAIMKTQICQSYDEKQHSYGNWETMQSLKHSKLCREAIDAVGWKGKLCMVNVKGDYAKEGFVYDLNSDEWADMPVGMLGGWRGPTAAMDEETMYVVDESRGVLRRYNENGDNWMEVIEDVRLKRAEYIAAGGGRVCVVGEKDVGIVVVDVVAAPPRLWVVETPLGHDILSLHILPRMCLPEFKSPVNVTQSK